MDVLDADKLLPAVTQASKNLNLGRILRDKEVVLTSTTVRGPAIPTPSSTRSPTNA
jgi:hypothetical protein